MGSKKVKPSGFSLFKHRIAGLFKDIVEVPPEELKVEEKIEEPVEDAPKYSPVFEEDPEGDYEAVRKKEREEMREKIHDHIVGNLNEAVARWKETGDVGLHLEPPVPLRERVKSFWNKIKPSVSVSEKLKGYADEVFEKVSSRLKKEEVHGKPVDVDIVIEEEWSSVLKRAESVSTSSERAEIEKIYKELGGK
ncbi:hypothetical protein KY319_00900 [Candidatus Woesearchaeota archaeon]|nr:hypothetical protein [Candidatus Woesearchaeota archaeon]